MKLTFKDWALHCVSVVDGQKTVCQKALARYQDRDTYSVEQAQEMKARICHDCAKILGIKGGDQR